ncbi:g11476 [Coccomyxa elongata]
MGQNTQEKFLERLTRAFLSLDAEKHVNTKEFNAAVEAILPVFDHLGTVFSFAKGEMNTKRESLVKIQDNLPTLTEVVEQDKKTNTVTKKNSCARNLHRLLSAVSFVANLLQNLAKDSSVTLHQAASDAYDATLAPVHTYFVRMAVKTSMYLLPDRATFIASIGETEATAREHGAKFVPAVEELLVKVLSLYEGTQMPASDVKFLPSSS